MTIEDEARAAAIERYSSRVIEDYDGDRYDEDEYGYDATARSAFVKGALWAASRREPSEASANVSNRPKDDISSGEMSVSEPSDTDERWEYVGDDERVRRFTDNRGVVEKWMARGIKVRRRTKAIPAGEWEVVPDGE